MVIYGLIFSFIAVIAIKTYVLYKQPLTPLQVGNSVIYVEVVEELGKLQIGLMGRKSLPENNGMLFVFSSEGQRTMWMKNTDIPLDMLWLNKSMEIVGIKENLPPCTTENCPTYTIYKNAAYVLEVNSGWIKRHNVKLGDKVRLIK